MKHAVLVILVALVAVPLGAQQAAPPPVQQAAAQPEPPQQSFQEFLAGIRAEALKQGIRAETLDLALSGLEPSPVVIARDRAQPELTQSLDEYLAARMTPQRINTANTARKTHAPLLARIEKQYGLPAHVMVSVWGLESNFGQFTGSYPTIMALATLAHDGRRALFRDELLAALKIVDAGRMAPADLKGSWAGAMGQPQFMPSSYLRHAVDFDNDGRADIWTTLDDVFASMANYLKNAGWQTGERWGREVRVTQSVMDKIERAVPMRARGCRAIREMTVARPLSEWRDLGVTLAVNRPLPADSTMQASLVRGKARHFLVYRNYEAILGYNCSHSYAISVGLLADQIQSGS